MEALLTVIVVLYLLISPFVLWYLYRGRSEARRENEKHRHLLSRLLSERRITPREVLQENLEVPPFRAYSQPSADGGQPQGSYAAGVGARTEQSVAAPPVPSEQESIQLELKKLRALNANGVITDDEFAAQKAKLLGQVPQAASPVQQPAPAAPIRPVPPVPQIQPVQNIQQPDKSLPPKEPVQPEKSVQPAAAKPVAVPPAPKTVPAPAPAPVPIPVRKQKNTTSAISVMLGVGVVLIILAGLLFVRTTWNAMADFGKLMTLAAGSLLFFGTSALAYKVWHLKRTGMAFFSLGATFLPISVWAAGYLSLLGEHLSGGSNPWLLCIAAAAFTVASAVGVKISRMKAWGLAFLIGFSATYLAGMWGLMPSYGAWTLAAAAFALLLTFFAKPLALRLPSCIGEVLGYFSMVYTLCAAVPMFIPMNGNAAWYGFAAFAAALAFLAPAMTFRLKQGSAVIMSWLTVYGFARVMAPLMEQDSLHLSGLMYTALVFMVTAMLLLIFLSTNLLPEETGEGFHWMFRVMSAVALVILLGQGISGADWNWLMLGGLALLAVTTLISVLRNGNIWLRSYFAAELLVLTLGFSNTLLHSADMALVLASALCFGCAVLFLCVRRLRSVFSDFLFPVAMSCCAAAVVSDYSGPLHWTAAAAVVLLCVAAFHCLFMALEHGMQTPAQYGFSGLFFVLLALFSSAAGEILLPKLGDGIFLLWTVLSAGIGLGLYYATKRGFAGVRHCIFCLCTYAPLFVGLFAFGCSGIWPLLLALVNAVIGWWLYRIYAGHGKRVLASAGFAAALYMLVQGVYFITQYGLDVPYDIKICAASSAVAVIFLLLGAAVFVMLRKKLRFVGDYAVLSVAAWVLPCVTVLYGILSASAGSDSVWQVILSLIAAGLALLLFAAYAWQEKRYFTIAAFGAFWVFVTEACCCAGYLFLFPKARSPLYGILMIAFGILLLLSLVMYAIRRKKLSFRGDYAVTAVAGLALPWNVFAYAVLSLVFVENPLWQILLALVTGTIALVLFADYARRDKRVLTVISFAAVLVFVLQAVYCSGYDYLFKNLRYTTRESGSMLICCGVIVLLGVISLCITGKKLRFVGDDAVHMVAQWVQPAAAVCCGVYAVSVSGHSPWQILVALTGALLGILLFADYARRERTAGAVASFSGALWLTMQGVFQLGYDVIFQDQSYASLMLSFAVLLLLAGFVMLLQRNVIGFFKGSRAIELTTQFALPGGAFFFAVAMLAMGTSAWHGFYYIFGLLLCLAAWFVSDARSYVGSGVAVCSFILATEALRQHIPWSGNGFVAAMLAGYVLLFVLFCYLGAVLRGDGAPHGWVLTVAGGVIPLWLLMAAIDSGYSASQAAWMRFCVPVLAAAYVFYLGRSALPERFRRGCDTTAAAMCTIALWMQPMFDFTGTYLEGKYHLLPLIAFGFALRKLYGKDTGGNLLFVFSVYAVIRLAVQALMHERPADLLTVLICGLVIFILAYYIKQKKWFLLGGITLCGVAVRLSPGLQWWMYLLLAGVLLIVIAAVNEMAKQKGESLKDKVGRFWEDWEW